MVEKMTKYSFVLLSGETEGFLKWLQDLGIVDVTRSTKPVDEKSSQMLDKVSRVTKTLSILEKLDYSADPDFELIRKAADKTCIEGCKAVNTLGATARLEELKAELASARKTMNDVAPWGDYDKVALDALSDKGLTIRYYCVPSKMYDPSWENDYAIVRVSETKGKVYFVTVSASDQEYSFPASPCEAPKVSLEEARNRIAGIQDEIIAQKGKLLHLKEHYLDHIRKGYARKSADLDRYLASTTAQDAAEGYVTVVTGFAPTENEESLKAELDAKGILYISEAATEEDNPPIKLKNNRFSKLFECLTGMYGMPSYGEWDPTPVLSIFFFLFFAMCMGDAGYGIILIIYGILQDKKIINISMFDGLGKLITVLGISTTIVGFFLGTAFGVDLSSASWMPEALRNVMLTGDITVGGSTYALQMVLALGIGVFHICLAMVIKAVLYTKRFGFKENISTWGWLILILGGIITAVIAMLGILPEQAVKVIVIVLGVVSCLGIFIFNKPGRNPLINIGAGLWDTYNMATGILGDVLSYIRLYALGLAGGMLGGAFNNLGSMVLGNDPTWQWLPFVIILLFGHVLNLLMSCLGAFVHPLRLTFVEYFKNSGYEGKGVKYNPLSNNPIEQ